MSAQEKRTYEITWPGRLHRSMKLLGLFEEEGTPEEQSALALFKAARELPAGRGTRHVIAGTREEVRYILWRLKGLEADARNGVITFEDLGVSTVELSKVVRQSPVYVGMG